MQPSAHAAADRDAYTRWQAIEAAVVSPLDRTPAFWKALITAYPYWRSRLAAPGRAYDSEEHGQLPIGGSAHADVMDLDVYLGSRDQRTRDEAVAMMGDSSPESVAYWRGLGRGSSRTTQWRRRNEIAEGAAGGVNETTQPQTS